MNEMRKALKKEIGAQAVVLFVNKRPIIWSRFCLNFRKTVSSTRFSSKESLDILLHSCRGDHQNRTRLPGLQKASRRADQAQKRPIHLRDRGSTTTVDGRCLLFVSLIIYSSSLVRYLLNWFPGVSFHRIERPTKSWTQPPFRLGKSSDGREYICNLRILI
jgi:hypothetical protein